MWVLQLEMSGTGKGEEGKTNMLLPNSILWSRFQKVGAKNRELESRSLLRTGVASLRYVARVTNGSGAHEHMDVHNSGPHAIVESVELVHGHEESAD